MARVKHGAEASMRDWKSGGAVRRPVLVSQNLYLHHQSKLKLKLNLYLSNFGQQNFQNIAHGM